MYQDSAGFQYCKPSTLKRVAYTDGICIFIFVVATADILTLCKCLEKEGCQYHTTSCQQDVENDDRLHPAFTLHTCVCKQTSKRHLQRQQHSLYLMFHSIVCVPVLWPDFRSSSSVLNIQVSPAGPLEYYKVLFHIEAGVLANNLNSHSFNNEHVWYILSMNDCRKCINKW